MRILASIVFIFFTLSSFGQTASQNMKELVFGNPFHASNQSYITMNNLKNKDRDLDDYLEFDFWTPIEVLSNEDAVIHMDSANYFIPDRKILLVDDGQLMELYPDQVKKAKLGNKVYQAFVESGKEGEGLKLFEVLGGTDFKFVKAKIMTEKGTDLHPMGLNVNGTTELVTSTKYYYVKEGSDEAIGVPRTKSKFVKSFKRHKKKIIKYLEKRKLSLKEEDDLIMIARYYNHLLNEKK